MSRPRLLDLFCGAGGAAMGYYRAGFDVVGVDIKPQPRYPFEFIQGDALDVLGWGHGMSDALRLFDAIHASPPCQAYSFASTFKGVKEKHPDLVELTRKCLEAWCTQFGKPYVIENVMGAPLINSFVLCGTMFDLGVFRHRQFESNTLLLAPKHAKHQGRATPLKKRTKWQPGEYLTVTGHFAYPLAQVQEAMGIDWMKHHDITQAIPPAYTEYIGKQLLAVLT